MFDRLPGRTRLVASVAAAITLVTLLLISSAQATVRKHATAKPTVVLVHGAWADSSR